MAQQFRFVDAQMAYFVMGKKEVVVEVALEIGVTPASGFVYLVFVGINQACIQMSQNTVRHPEQGMLG